MGASTHLTPREVIRDFIELLDIVSQNPQVSVAQLLESGSFDYAQPLEPGSSESTLPAAAPADGRTAAANPYAEFTI